MMNFKLSVGFLIMMGSVCWAADTTVTAQWKYKDASTGKQVTGRKIVDLSGNINRMKNEHFDDSILKKTVLLVRLSQEVERSLREYDDACRKEAIRIEPWCGGTPKNFDKAKKEAEEAGREFSVARGGCFPPYIPRPRPPFSKQCEKDRIALGNELLDSTSSLWKDHERDVEKDGQFKEVKAAYERDLFRPFKAVQICAIGSTH